VGRLERFVKLCRAHPQTTAFVGVTISLLGALLVGLVWWTIQQQRLIAQRDEQNTLAMGILRSMTLDVQTQLEHIPAARDVRQRLLNQTVDRLGQITRYVDGVNRADEVALATYNDIGMFLLQLGRHDASKPVLERAHQIGQLLYERNPHDADALRGSGVSVGNLAGLAEREGRLGDAKRLYEQAIARLESMPMPPKRNLAHYLARLGCVDRQLGDTQASLAPLRRSIAIYEQLIAGSDRDTTAEIPSAQRDSDVRHGLWESNVWLCESLLAVDPAAAEQHARAALSLAEREVNNPWLGNLGRKKLSYSYRALGAVLLRQQRIEEAKSMLETALQIDQTLLELDPQDTEQQRGVAFVHDLLGNMWLSVHDAKSALSHFQKAFALRRAIAATGAPAQAIAPELLWSYCYLGEAAHRAHEFDEARRVIQEARQVCGQLDQDANMSARVLSAQFRSMFSQLERKCELELQSVESLDELIDREPRMAEELLTARVALLLQRGAIADAVATADRASASATDRPDELVFAANNYGMIHKAVLESVPHVETESVSLSEKMEVRAMEVLRKLAQSQSLTRAEVAIVKYSPHLSSLRPLPPFQEMLKELESHAAPRPQPK
jgi:tetratricopeptide (TPR) repeat protein